MKYEITHLLRVFPVEVKDNRTGKVMMDRIALDRRTLENARQIGMDHEALIWRLYNQKGYYVIRIGKPMKQEAKVDLTALYRQEGVAL